MILDVAVGIFFGCLLAAASCTAAEVRNPLLRDTQGTEVAGLPVLAEIPRRPGKRELRKSKVAFQIATPIPAGEG